VRIAELKKEAYEFKRDIVVGAENFRTGVFYLCATGCSHLTHPWLTGKTMAENVIRYMEEKLRTKVLCWPCCVALHAT
jgi:hypothetical protein